MQPLRKQANQQSVCSTRITHACRAEATQGSLTFLAQPRMA